MTPQEKAEELLEKYDETLTYLESKSKAKQCALIAVDMLIKCTPSMNIYPPNFQSKNPRVKEYWQEVKTEIEKL
jgi:hypothetical protein